MFAARRTSPLTSGCRSFLAFVLRVESIPAGEVRRSCKVEPSQRTHSMWWPLITSWTVPWMTNWGGSAHVEGGPELQYSFIIFTYPWYHTSFNRWRGCSWGQAAMTSKPRMKEPWSSSGKLGRCDPELRRLLEAGPAFDRPTAGCSVRNQTTSTTTYQMMAAASTCKGTCHVISLRILDIFS